MSLPTFTLEVAFTQTNAFLPPGLGSGTDIHADLTSLGVRRGRQTEQDQAATGTCSFVLSDDTRKYDSKNASSPYFGNLVPSKGVLVHAILDAVGYYVFAGAIDPLNCWQRDESEPGRAVVTTQANDSFDMLNNGFVYTGAPYAGTKGAAFPSELTGQRIFEILGAAAFPGGRGSLDGGLETMQASAAVDNAGVSALQLIRDAELTEPGFFFIDSTGSARFQDRRHRLLATSQATFCDVANFSAGRILFESVTTRRVNMVNDATVTATGFAAQEYADSASVQQYLTRPGSYATKHISAAAALSSAQWRVSQAKDPYEVLESLTLTPGTDSAIWAQVLGREIGDRITVMRTPQNTGAVETVDCFIESISFDWGPGPQASCTWRLSNADQSAYWLAGTVGRSEAGTTTRAGY